MSIGLCCTCCRPQHGNDDVCVTSLSGTPGCDDSFKIPPIHAVEHLSTGELARGMTDSRSLALEPGHLQIPASIYEERADRPTDSFMITITQGNGTPLGLDVFQDMQKRIRIRKLGRGLVYQWNVANPELYVQEGDCIREINGVGGGYAQMLSVAMRDDLLHIRIIPMTTDLH